MGKAMKNTNEMKILLESFNEFISESFGEEIHSDNAYEYKKESNIWYSRSKGNTSWTSLADNQEATDKLEKEYGSSLLSDLGFGEQTSSSSDSDDNFSAIVYNNSGAKPVSALLNNTVRKILPGFVKSGFDALVRHIPQGHAGIIMIDPDGSAFNVDFGAGSTWGCSDNKSFRTKLGLFTMGGTRVKRLGRVPLNQKGNLSNTTINNLVNKTNHTEFAIIKNFNFSTAFAYATTPECRPYSIIPGIYDGPGTSSLNVVEGENCGSFIYKVAMIGNGLSPGSTAAGVLSNLLTSPDQVISLLKTAGIAE
jgi:hypothetical protein